MPSKTPKDRPTRRTVVIGGSLVLLGLTLLAYLIHDRALAAEIGWSALPVLCPPPATRPRQR